MAKKSKSSNVKDSLSGEKHIKILPQDQDIIIEDFDSGSKGMYPIHTSPSGVITDIHIDKGMIQGLPQESIICDRLLNYDGHNEKSIRINCFVELKGSKKADKAEHAADQIIQTIHYADDKAAHPEFAEWMDRGDLCIAVIAGAPDKTLPPLANESAKNLGKLLKSKSRNRKCLDSVMDYLYYVKLDKQCRKAELRGQAPKTIVCFNKKGAFAPFPELLVKTE